jgi:hypothetical protein
MGGGVRPVQPFGLGPFDARFFEAWVGKSAPSLAAELVRSHTEMTITAEELVMRKEAAFALMAQVGAGTGGRAHLCSIVGGAGDRAAPRTCRSYTGWLRPRCM